MPPARGDVCTVLKQYGQYWSVQYRHLLTRPTGLKLHYSTTVPQYHSTVVKVLHIQQSTPGTFVTLQYKDRTWLEGDESCKLHCGMPRAGPFDEVPWCRELPTTPLRSTLHYQRYCTVPTRRSPTPPEQTSACRPCAAALPRGCAAIALARK